MSSDSSESEERTLKRLFIISPIGEPNSQTRIRSDQVKKYLIDPVAEELNYETIRADGISEPGRITDQIIERLLNDDLVVADLTEHNPNVFYELAVRHAIGEPVILFSLRGQKIPFDVSAQRVIFYDHTNLDSIDEAKAELKRQILAVESNDFIVDSPIRTHVPLDSTENREAGGIALQEIITILRNQSEKLSYLYTNLDDTRMQLTNIEKEINNLKNETQYFYKLQNSLETLRSEFAYLYREREQYAQWSELLTPTTGKKAKRDEWIDYLAKVEAIPVWDETLQPYPVYFRRLNPKYDIAHLRGFGKKTRKRVAQILGIRSKEDCERVRKEIKAKFRE